MSEATKPSMPSPLEIGAEANAAVAACIAATEELKSLGNRVTSETEEVRAYIDAVAAIFKDHGDRLIASVKAQAERNNDLLKRVRALEQEVGPEELPQIIPLKAVPEVPAEGEPAKGE